MLKKWLRTVNELVRFGVAAASAVADGRRSRTSGRASRTNGRMSRRSSGVASRASGTRSALASSIRRTAGRSRSAVGRSTFAKVSTLPSVAVVCSSAPGRLRTARDRFASSEAKARNVVAEVSISCAMSESLDASSSLSPRREVTSRRRFCLRVATAVCTRARSRKVGSKRANTSRRSPPRPFSPRPAPSISSCR